MYTKADLKSAKIKNKLDKIDTRTTKKKNKTAFIQAKQGQRIVGMGSRRENKSFRTQQGRGQEAFRTAAGMVGSLTGELGKTMRDENFGKNLGAMSAMAF